MHHKKFLVSQHYPFNVDISLDMFDTVELHTIMDKCYH